MKARADFYETFRAEMLASKKLKNRLIRYWGVETIDGVEVFRKNFQASIAPQLSIRQHQVSNESVQQMSYHTAYHS